MFNTVISNARTSVVRARPRALHTTPVALKTMTEKVSEVADKV